MYLTHDDLRKRAPSIFAEHKKEGLSDSRYNFVPTIQVVEDMEKSGWFPVRANEVHVNKADREGYQKHLIRFRQHQDMTVGDRCIETVLTNSHDGKSSFIFMLGIFELVCSNGLIVSRARFEDVRFTHSQYQTKNIHELSGMIVKNSNTITRTIKEMQSITMSKEQTQAFGTVALNKKYDNVSNLDVLHVINKRRHYEDNSLWTVFNVVQENMIKGGIKINRRRTRGITAIDSTINLNQELWDLAEQFKVALTAQAMA